MSNQTLISLQGCNKLVSVGADGVSQAMVLSFAGLKFREDHLELNSHPKDLHRDYHIRRVSYGNGTHLNISGTYVVNTLTSLYCFNCFIVGLVK